jgi:histidinol-phosphate aminotransferase
MQDVKNALVKERERLFGLLQGVPFLKPYPSAANFILCDVKESHDAKAIKVRVAQERWRNVCGVCSCNAK